MGDNCSRLTRYGLLSANQQIVRPWYHFFEVICPYVLKQFQRNILDSKLLGTTIGRNGMSWYFWQVKQCSMNPYKSLEKQPVNKNNDDGNYHGPSIQIFYSAYNPIEYFDKSRKYISRKLLLILC